MNELLVKARENKKLSRKELAESLGISLSMVHKVESGSRRVSPNLAKKWGDKLDIEETHFYRYFFAEQPDIMCRNIASDPHPAA